MSRLIGLALADIHVNDWKENYGYKGDRLQKSLVPLQIVGDIAKNKGIPLLIPGDLFHTPKSLSNKVFDAFIDTYDKYLRKVTIVAISGNHDQFEKNTFDHRSPSYIKTLSRILPHFHCVDFNRLPLDVNGEQVSIYGIPYLTNNIDFKKVLHSFKPDKRDFNILLIHSDIPGAKNGFGFEIGQVREIEDVDKLFIQWDLVLCGHIHKPQQLGNSLYMLGSPGHQNAGDVGIDMGYWEIYSNAKPKFVKLKLPEYKYYQIEEGMPNDDNIYIPVSNKSQISETLMNVQFNNKMSKTKIAKNYMKAKGIKKKSKKKALIKILRST